MGQVLVVSGRGHLHVAALGVFAEGGGVVDGGVGILTVEGAAAGHGALGVICKHTHSAARYHGDPLRGLSNRRFREKTEVCVRQK